MLKTYLYSTHTGCVTCVTLFSFGCVTFLISSVCRRLFLLQFINRCFILNVLKNLGLLGIAISKFSEWEGQSHCSQSTELEVPLMLIINNCQEQSLTRTVTQTKGFLNDSSEFNIVGCMT